jgi:hypothetical protein
MPDISVDDRPMGDPRETETPTAEGNDEGERRPPESGR